MAHCSETILRASSHSSPQPRTERGAIMSEDNIIFLNDLLLPHVGAISTYSLVPQHIQPPRTVKPPDHMYGFGLLDAALMVQRATLFNTVSPQRNCIQEVTLHPARILSPGGEVSVDIESDACRGKTNEINTLEHVQVRVSLSAVCRGDLSISLESPSGTVSLLLDKRPNDASTAGLKNWTLLTVHCWGEEPQGLWTFQVTDHKGTVLSCKQPSDEEASGALLRVTLILYGTYHPHRAVQEGPLQSIVSMGSRHPVPHRGLLHGGCNQTLELIECIYQMERDRKIQAADITLPDRHKMLKIPGDSVLDEQTLRKLLKSSMAFQLHQTDVAQKSSTGSEPAVVKELHETKNIMEYLDRVKRSLPLRTLRDITNSLQIQEWQKDGGRLRAAGGKLERQT
ncbi:hypothetical protein PBY51_018113 [Eleginops maclovinus]|uniref:P/Homo B domain-containing protein n=2 Tax=Eleginops maclovinus TaxID=56733 RepID=A0AAN7XKP0_ELEMC|nr:hypothetical protein PBY51_018113 [Eleginops maclovinus]